MSDVRSEDLRRPVLPQGWAWTELQRAVALPPNSLTDGPFGSKLKSAHYVESGVRVIRLGNLGVAEFKNADKSYITHEHFETLRKHEVFPGDLLIAALAEPVGRCCEVPDDIGTAIVKADCIRFVPHADLKRPFVMHWLNSPRGRKNAEILSHGIGRLRINMGNMRVVPLPVAPLNEQKRIVAKIEALQHRADAAKAALDAIPPLLEKFRQSVLAAAFRGDLTQAWRAQNPDAEPATALLERIRAERRARWIEAAAEKARARAGAKATKAGKPWPDDANAQVLERERAKAAKTYKAPEPVDTEGLPDLPAGWCWARWEEVGLCQNGRAFPSKHYCAEGTKLLRPGNLHVSGDVRWTDKNTRHMPDEWVVQYPSFVIGANELVMNLTAQSLKDEFLGRVCLTSDGERCLLNQRIARLTPIVLTPRFCLWLFKGQVFRRYVENGLNTGSLIQHMFTSQVYDFVFPLPPEEEHEQIVDAVEALLNFKRGVEDGVVEMDTRLPGLNQSILAKAFRGELVPQDPTDEPASVLLERIRAERAAAEAAKPKKTRRRRAPAKGHPSTVTEESE